MILSLHQQIFSQNVALLILKANSFGINLTFGEAYRTKEQQQIHLNNGKTKTMKSNHLKRLAVDLNFFIDGKLLYTHNQITNLGLYWESLDNLNRWGGKFTKIYDPNHFERHLK